VTISQAHANRRPHNWLIYDIGDEWLNRFTDHYKGHLYDLGCGEMPYKAWLLNYTDTYTGVDWGSSLHDLKADILADLNEPLPIENEVADTVISLSVMEHLREPQVFLSEAHRILKQGGAMILQVPFMWWVHEAPYDYYRYTQFGLQYVFEKAGFVDVQVYPQTGFWSMWTLKFNYQSTRLIRGPWPIRKATALLLRSIWAIDQRIAPWLDKHWKGEGETAGYFVVAKKPKSLEKAALG
jgi:SAM-dependent methyltransferase